MIPCVDSVDTKGFPVVISPGHFIDLKVTVLDMRVDSVDTKGFSVTMIPCHLLT